MPKNIQWCSRCKSQHQMPICEFIALPVSEGGHIPDWMYNYEEPCEHRKHISSGGKCYFCEKGKVVLIEPKTFIRVPTIN